MFLQRERDLKQRTRTQRRRPDEDRGCDWGDGAASHKARQMADTHRTPGRSKEGSSRSLRRGQVLPTACFQTGGLQNREPTHSRCLTPPSVQPSVPAALGNERGWDSNTKSSDPEDTLSPLMEKQGCRVTGAAGAHACLNLTHLRLGRARGGPSAEEGPQVPEVSSPNPAVGIGVEGVQGHVQGDHRPAP